MRNLILLIVVSTIVLTTTSCQKEKLKNLTGIWVNKSEGYIDTFRIGCDSFFLKTQYINQMNPSVELYWGTYSLKKDRLTITGVYQSGDSVRDFQLVSEAKISRDKMKLRGIDIEGCAGDCTVEYSKTQDIKCE